jgi:hypothetical protein
MSYFPSVDSMTLLFIRNTLLVDHSISALVDKLIDRFQVGLAGTKC